MLYYAVNNCFILTAGVSACVAHSQAVPSLIPPHKLAAALQSLFGLAAAREAEAEAAKAAAADSPVPLPPRIAAPLREGDVTWARTLAANLDRLDSWVEWRSVRNGLVMPAVARLQATCVGVESVKEWVKVRRLAVCTCIRGHHSDAVRSCVNTRVKNIDFYASSSGDAGLHDPHG